MNKHSKQSVRYEEPARGKDRCADCVHYVSPTVCDIVMGVISPRGWCEKFHRKRRTGSEYG